MLGLLRHTRLQRGGEKGGVQVSSDIYNNTSSTIGLVMHDVSPIQAPESPSSTANENTLTFSVASADC